VRITVVGLGYVGAVSGACLAESGHDIILVDVNPIKVEQLNSGISPISELGLDELVRANVGRGRLAATDDMIWAMKQADAVLICVGTPTGRNGDVHLDDVLAVAGQIGRALAQRPDWCLVLVTSTVPPGTVEQQVVPVLERESGKRSVDDFGIAFSPEFLREGSAIADFTTLSKTVIGAEDGRSATTAESIFRPFTADVQHTSIRVAEMAKFADNAWHALKVAFTNEVGRICDGMGIDSQEVMRIFRADLRLNVSPAYLTPGFAFGGSCLPKDLRTLTYRARALGVSVPVLESILPSNHGHLQLAISKIQATGRKRVALLGLAFKCGTDDLRESPALELAECLLGKGYSVAIHDEYLSLAKLVGANRDYLLRVLPHVASLLNDDLRQVLDGADIVVVAQRNPRYSNVVDLAGDRPVLDLTGVARPLRATALYDGLTW